MNKELVIDHSARSHSSVGGSSAKRIMECPGSLLLTEKFLGKSSEFAEEGTAMHEALDLILQDKTKSDDEVVGLVFNGIEITRDMFDEGIAPALETFDALNRELGGIDFYNEQRVVFPGIDGAFGTVDVVGSSKDRTVILDWKMGQGVPVEAEANAQLMYYAYAAAHTAPTSKFFDRDKPIELYIVQPRVNDGEPFTRWMTSFLQLEAFAVDLKHAVDTALQPDAPYRMGPWCKFCSAKSGCPLFQGVAQNALALSPDELRDHLLEWLPHAASLKKLGETIETLAHAAMENGVEISGWKLVNKRAKRSWVDEAKTLRYLGKVGLPAAERYVKEIVSPKQAEDALKRNGLPAELPKGLAEAISSGTTLVPASDPRAAVPIVRGSFEALASRLAAN